MQTFRSMHLQKNLGEVQDAARKNPVLFLNHGQPKTVMMSVEEFRRLKVAAGEAVPVEAQQRRAVIQQGLPEDPLGYDTSNLRACALAMAEDALSGRDREAVRAEIKRAERRLGLGKSRQ
jgi:hypothetical protein